MEQLKERYRHSTEHEIKQNFFSACSKDKLEEVKYVLKNYNFDISSDNYLSIRTACMYGSIDVLNYLYKHYENNIDIHTNNDACFKMATRMKQYNIIEYLIFEKNIIETDSIKTFLEKNPNNVIKSMFSARRLNKQLTFDFYKEETKLKL